MNQEHSKTPSSAPISMSPVSPSSPPKKWTWKETLSVVFLVLLPIVGLILMWVITNWSKRAKITITVILFLPIIIIMVGILASIVLVFLGEIRGLDRDAVRKTDMRMIISAQKMYYVMNHQYYQSANYPISISDFMIIMPTDPITQGPYGWIDNTKDNQKFCAFAILERNGFYVATHRGGGKIATEPRTLSNCEKFLRF